ncbi:putative leucine-rich repeat receptor-like serine/threonine-protein kinase At2g24130 [Cryptomeria japonica]|uniref:putative leucine-rich repeat receptor-like serine/threonine-protein kinase At2g24130 n=1 Tax=Cryptomeria japonica TaxID=3369 RepID=UPI0027DA75CA|nr:putative leucine-rich repeat receptor-like serine/threonine-protein kinase At2g24130 [Cryptomeria japonica]
MQHLGLLNVGQNQLSGKIPDSLCSPQQLRYLYLQHNNLSGEFPVSLEGCQKLELLDISYHKLGGRIPRGVIASLKNLQFYLNLSSNSLQGFLPQEMSKIVMAQAIDISRNRLTGVIPKTLGGCTALEHLNLSHNAFEGPIPDSLSKLQNLQEMDLSANFLSGSIPMSFGRLKVLNYMNVSFNNLSGQIPDEGLFPNRTVVTLFGGNIGLCGPRTYSLPPCPKLTQEKHSLMKKIVLPVVGTIALILVSFIIGMLWRHKLSRKILHPSNLFFQRLVYQKISYQDLVIATSGFDESNLLGVGNFGSVYKGILRDGKIVAIKALNLDNEESHKSFNTECRVLGRIRHRNLIRVTSAFYYPSLKGLVLQYASNGSLEKHLHPDRDDQVFFKFGLSECLSIALDVAHGMEYLHHDCPMQIVHCDLKPSNVLLDANMTALVTDFGISRLIATPNSTYSLSTTTFALKGSIGYIAPEYGLGGGVSIKGDVYSYGILLLEMVTRKRPSDDMFMGDLNLQNWVRSSFPDRVAEIIDSRLLRDVNANMEENGFLLSFITVGFLCTNESPRERPSMRDVARALENLKRSLTGNAASSNLKSSISDLLRNINPTGLSVSDSQSSTF